jgi:hypothetical protein
MFGRSWFQGSARQHHFEFHRRCLEMLIFARPSGGWPVHTNVDQADLSKRAGAACRQELSSALTI